MGLTLDQHYDKEYVDDDKEESTMTGQYKAPKWKAKKQFKGRCYNCLKYEPKGAYFRAEMKQKKHQELNIHQR